MNPKTTTQLEDLKERIRLLNYELSEARRLYRCGGPGCPECRKVIDEIEQCEKLLVKIAPQTPPVNRCVHTWCGFNASRQKVCWQCGTNLDVGITALPPNVEPETYSPKLEPAGGPFPYEAPPRAAEPCICFGSRSLKCLAHED